MPGSQSNSPASTDSSGGSEKQVAKVDISKMDMSTVKWQGQAQQSVKKSQVKSQRRVEYKVDDVGVVAEEWRISVVSTDEHPTTELALHSVYVNGKLVRQIDLKTKKVLQSEAKYEPYSFLRYGTVGSTEQPQQQTAAADKVPVIGAGPAKDDAADKDKQVSEDAEQ